MATVSKCPNADIAITNKVAVPPGMLPAGTKHIVVMPAHGGQFLFSIVETDSVKPGQLGFTTPHRKWMKTALNEQVNLKPLAQAPAYAGKVVVSIDFLKAGTSSRARFNSEAMMATFRDTFANSVLTAGQDFAFNFEHDGRKVMFALSVKKLFGSDLGALAQGQTSEAKTVASALVFSQTEVQFQVAEGSDVALSGKAAGGGGAVSDWACACDLADEIVFPPSLARLEMAST